MSEPKFHPLVSVVIPVFNGGNYMREAIDSALAQTYDNVEVIVVNDGSSDNGKTDAIARSYGERIRYFVKDNGGCASALNFGIAEMRGSYFSWLSHDDRYHPNKVAHQIEILRSLDDKQTIVFGGYDLIDQRSEARGSVRPETVLPIESLDIPLLPLLRGLVHGCTLLISREHFDRVGVFDVNRPSTQDYALWFDMFRSARLHFDPTILIQSRVHPDQGTHRIEKHIDECNDLWSGFLQRLTEDEMVAMSGSPCAFFTDTARFLRDTPYKEAAELAQRMAKDARGDLKVSVVIPFYNRIDWTIEAIQSVQAQTHQNFEILLIDDGSTEDLTLLNAAVGADHRIQYFRQANSGPAKARNLGIELATGSYIAFLDADDLFLPTKLERQLTFMLDNAAHFSHTSYRRMDGSGIQLRCIRLGRSLAKCSRKSFQHARLPCQPSWLELKS
ncbi:glycosyltransferase [Rhizobium sp. AN80A]|uniref:glycosyltransferase family 2 protein n=1 Tax=Rhizobium sp. AN80A TaxID=3040673 RepID=UPI0024B3C7ED|nr:glycosyltransferase [Rhizobium sp. AN80A]